TNQDEAVLKVKVDRRNFTGEIPLTFEKLPAGVTLSDTNVPAGAGELAITISANEKAAAGTNYAFTIQGVAMSNDRLYRHKTGPIKLSLAVSVVEIATNGASVPKQP